jgi:hypothetical protein
MIYEPYQRPLTPLTSLTGLSIAQTYSWYWSRTLVNDDEQTSTLRLHENNERIRPEKETEKKLCQDIIKQESKWS